MSCPLCGDERPGRLGLHAHGTWLASCPTCGFVRVVPMPDAEEAAGLYHDGYFLDAKRGYVDYVADEPVFRAEFRRRLRTLERLGAAGRLLDVGCASGALLAEARARGFRASGLEPAPRMARRAAERSGCPVRASTLEDALLAPVSFDVVTLFDVLEHMVDPRRALSRLRLVLAPGGVLAVTVPDFGGLWAQLSGARWPFLTPWEHLVYFTRRTLRAMLRTAGYEHVQYHPVRTPVSFATLAAKSPLPARLVPATVAHRGFGLPFGTLFATARPSAT